MKKLPSIICLVLAALFVNSALADSLRHRVIVTSDIGGTDPDDYQSMAHVLLYADVLDIEGLVSSPFEREGKSKILEVIDAYEKDFPNLHTWSDHYPTPDSLRAITKQGGIHPAPYSGLRGSTEGSDWIVECARRDDPRPLHILVWGAIEDVAQALHDAPDILPKLRVYYIGGPNKKWGPDAYQYIADNFPSLWIIEANSTYRGYFAGGNQEGEWGNASFVKAHVAGRGAIGTYFAEHLGGVIKMGDTPSVNWLLGRNPTEPAWPGWGGRFVRAWERPFARFNRLTTEQDRIEIFGIMELILPIGPDAPEVPEGRMLVTNQSLIGYADGKGNLRFRFCPRDPTTFTYEIKSNVPELHGRTGAITAFLPDPKVALEPSARFSNWWTDDPSPALAEGIHHGAKSVSQWREAYLQDFAVRMERCVRSAPSAAVRIMPVGDSITAGEHYRFPALEERTGYRKPLYDMLTTAGYDVDFVGSQNHGIRSRDTSDWYDWNCEAYPGWKIPEITEKLESALTTYDPDILLLHVGTNGKDWEQKPAHVSDLLDRVNNYAVSANRGVTVLLCLIINRFESEDPAPTSQFNRNVAKMVKQRTGDQIKIVLVDMENGADLDYSDRSPESDKTPPDDGGDMFGTRYPGVPLDRYHPNDKGNLKMARKFFDELVKELGGLPGRRLTVSQNPTLKLTGR